MNFTKTFVTVFLVISLLTTAYVFSETNKNNWEVEKYVAKLEIMSVHNDSFLTNWMLENSKYKDFHFTTNCNCR